jgi:nucleotide-binding universal stress UspA family protein
MTREPVLVGVDGSQSSLAAVDLAVREASLRGLPVRVVHADVWATHPAWVDTDPTGTLADDLLADPQRALRTALDHAAGCATGVPVSGEVVAGNPVTVLIRESARAELLVLGHRGHGGFPELLLGSVAMKLAAHARCPVLVTRGAGRVTGDVVVGVDGSSANDPAIGFAFEEACLRQVPLLALHTWSGPAVAGPTDLLPPLYQPSIDEAEEMRVLANALSEWQIRYPEVTVQRRLRWARANRALVEASHHAQLVVVGARGRGGLPGLRLGAVTHALLHHAACPVATVHHRPV